MTKNSTIISTYTVTLLYYVFVKLKTMNYKRCYEHTMVRINNNQVV